MPKSKILVVAKEPMIGALMAQLVELAGHTPLFPYSDEHPLEAIMRLRPRLLLLDCEQDIACEDEAYKRAERVGCKVLLFSPRHTAEEIREFAQRRDVEFVALPLSLPDFRGAIENALH